MELATEIWQEVFTSAVLSESPEVRYKTMAAIACTARRWYTILQTCEILWSFLRVDPGGELPAGGSLRSETTVRAHIARAGNTRALDILVVFPDPTDARDGYEEQAGIVILDLLLGLKNRWRDVLILAFARCPARQRSSRLCSASIGTRIQESSATCMSNLRHFALMPGHGNDLCEHYQPVFQVLDCPSLRFLDVHVGAGVFRSSHLQELILSHIEAPDVLQMLRACPQLAILRWRYYQTHTWEGTTVPVSLPLLHLLDLEGPVALPCRVLEAPKLQKLVVSYRRHDAMFSGITQLGAASTIACLDLADVDVDTLDLNQIISGLPNLRELVFRAGQLQPRRESCLRVLRECVQRRRETQNPFIHVLMVFYALRKAEEIEWKQLKMLASAVHERTSAYDACFLAGCDHDGFFH